MQDHLLKLFDVHTANNFPYGSIKRHICFGVTLVYTEMGAWLFLAVIFILSGLFCSVVIVWFCHIILTDLVHHFGVVWRKGRSKFIQNEANHKKRFLRNKILKRVIVFKFILFNNQPTVIWVSKMRQ